jgi:hypothetical protein
MVYIQNVKADEETDFENNLDQMRKDLESFKKREGCEIIEVVQNSTDLTLPPGVKSRKPILKYAYYCKELFFKLSRWCLSDNCS